MDALAPRWWSRPGGLVTHPAMVAALVVLAVNDHVLKARFHNALTGILSDVAGLMLVPAVLTGAAEMAMWLRGRPPPSRQRAVAVAGAPTAIGFAASQTLAPATAALRWASGLIWVAPVTVVADRADLLAIPAVAVGWLITRRRDRAGARAEGREARRAATSRNRLAQHRSRR